MNFVCSCCFCGRSVKKTKIDPCTLYISPRKGEGQSFWPHAKCFRRAMHKAYRDDLMEELGGPKLKLDFSKMRRIQPHEMPWLKSRSARGRKAKFLSALKRIDGN